MANFIHWPISVDFVPFTAVVVDTCLWESPCCAESGEADFKVPPRCVQLLMILFRAARRIFVLIVSSCLLPPPGRLLAMAAFCAVYDRHSVAAVACHAVEDCHRSAQYRLKFNGRYRRKVPMRFARKEVFWKNDCEMTLISLLANCSSDG